MDSNFFREKSTSRHFFYYFPLDNFPFSNKLKVDEFQFKNEYLVISWSRDGGPAQWPNGSGVWLWIGSFEARFSSRVLSGCLAHSYFGCQWILSASNLSTHSKKKKKAIKKIKFFNQKMFYPWTKINFAKSYFKTKKIETLAKKWQRFCLIDFQIFCCSDVLPDVRFPPFFCENGFSIF